MGKRFTETNKWETPHFRGLSLLAKVVLQYLHDRCDVAGVWEPDFGLAEFLIGNGPLDWDEVERELGDRIRILRSGKWWLTRHVRLQCGQLRASVPPHRSVIKLLEEHGISLADSWLTGDTAPEEPSAAPAAPSPVIPILPPNAGVLAQLYIAQGTDPARATVREKDNLLKALKMILEAEPGATEEQVASAAVAYRKKYPKAPITAKAIADHWSELAPAQRSEEEVNRLKTVRDDLAELHRKLAPFMHRPFGIAICKPELSDEQIDEARSLKERIDNLERHL